MITAENFTRVRVLLTRADSSDTFHFEIEGLYRLSWHANIPKMAQESVETVYKGPHKSFTRLFATLKSYLETSVKNLVRDLILICVDRSRRDPSLWGVGRHLRPSFLYLLHTPVKQCCAVRELFVRARCYRPNMTWNVRNPPIINNLQRPWPLLRR